MNDGTNPPQAPILSDAQRYWLKLNPALGAGNFLHVAAGFNTGSDLPLLWSDVSFNLNGQRAQGPLSLRQLKQAADVLASWYLMQGVRAKDPVGIYGSNGVHCLLHYVALTALGAIPALTNGAMPTGTAHAHMRRVGAVGVVADEAQYEAFEAVAGANEFRFVACMDRIEPPAEAVLPAVYPFAHDYLDPVMITHSSGTTGVPKPVLLQHGKWFHGIRHLLGQPAAQGAERYLSCLPVSHNAAIAYAMHALLCGAALMIVSHQNAPALIQCIESFKPSTVASFPSNYVAMVAHGLDGVAMDSVSAWINSGDAAHEAHIRQLVRHGHHYRGRQKIAGSQFVDGLGSSEMGHSSFRVVYTAGDRNFDRCVGLPQEWVQARVLADDGSEMPVGQVGKLGIKSPSVTSGYWNDSLLTHCSQLAGFWLTGDLVYKDHAGCFFHVDRTTDAISTVEGTLYSQQTEELILKICPELLDCTVLGQPLKDGETVHSEPVVFAVPYRGQLIDDVALLARINREQQRLGRPRLARMKVVDLADISVGITGKVVKQVMRQRMAENAI